MEVMGFDSNSGFVDLEFFELSFAEQAQAYKELVLKHGVFIHPAEPMVELLAAPSVETAIDLLAFAAEYTAQVNHDPANDYGEKVLNGLCIPAGMEMVNFTFGIKRCSRVFTHQMVRHRLASVSQSNSRDRLLPPVFVLPFDAEDDSPANRVEVEEARAFCQYAYLQYLERIIRGVEPQDARYLLPDTTVQSMVFDVDFKSLQGMCAQRLCVNMQPEMSYVAHRMKELVLAFHPRLGKMLKCTCDKIKACLPIQCNVYEGCGKWPISMSSKTGKRPVSQTSTGPWMDIRERFFGEQ